MISDDNRNGNGIQDLNHPHCVQSARLSTYEKQMEWKQRVNEDIERQYQEIHGMDGQLPELVYKQRNPGMYFGSGRVSACDSLNQSLYPAFPGSR